MKTKTLSKTKVNWVVITSGGSWVILRSTKNEDITIILVCVTNGGKKWQKDSVICVYVG